MSISEELGQVTGVGSRGFFTIMTALGIPESLIHVVLPMVAGDARVYPVPLTRKVIFVRPWAPKVPLKGVSRTRQALFVDAATGWNITLPCDWHQTIGETLLDSAGTRHVLVEYVPALALEHQIPFAGGFVGARPCLHIFYDPSQF